MLYGDISKIDTNSGEKVGNSNKKRAEPVLVLLSDLYSELESISVNTSGLSSYPASHYLLTT